MNFLHVVNQTNQPCSCLKTLKQTGNEILSILRGPTGIPVFQFSLVNSFRAF